MPHSFLRGAIALALLSIGAQAAHADSPRFRDIEYLFTHADALTSSSEAPVEGYRTVDVEAARTILDAMVPVGTPLPVARERLVKAGAHCDPGAAGGTINCHYFDSETRDEYVDAVHWTIGLQSNAGAVTDLTLQRRWTRH